MSCDNILHVTLTNNPDEVPPNRLRGTSTALALKYVSDAILKPGTHIVVTDHHGTAAADKHLLNSVEYVIARLRLVGFKVGRDSVTQKYFCCFNLTVS